MTSAVAEQSEPAEARHQEATPPPKAPTAGRLAVTSPGVVNSAFAWLRGKVGKSPLGKPAPPDSATAPDEPKVEPEPARAAPEHPEQVLAEPPPPSLEDVMAKGKPHLEAGAAEWLRQLPGSAVTVVERTHRLYTELLVAEGGDASAMEACLAAAISSAGVQVGPRRQVALLGGSAHSHTPRLELTSAPPGCICADGTAVPLRCRRNGLSCHEKRRTVRPPLRCPPWSCCPRCTWRAWLMYRPQRRHASRWRRTRQP